ncbi:MAG: protein translocase subunit SecF [Candidatus Eisenbacteria bacterium]|nr:protein translocase subunit SecF [Candidatus Eisenbacteria bacterium]
MASPTRGRWRRFRSSAVTVRGAGEGETARTMLTIFTNTRIDFMSRRRAFFVVSAVVILIGIASFLLHGGFRLGIDFSGGRLIEYGVPAEISVEDVRAAAGDVGFGQAEIQRVRGVGDSRMLIRIPEIIEQRGGEASPSALIRDALIERHPGADIELLREESVGAKVGKEIRGQAFWAIVIALGLILLYIAFRFEFWFGVGAIVALAHDVLVTLTIFSLLDREITMPVVAALLTIAGYSINDSIVVFDRIREQLVRLRRESFPNVLNISINQTLSRTVITAITTLFASLALLIFGGEVIRDFALAMTVGVIVGTYSSIFVASAMVLELRTGRETKATA